MERAQRDPGPGRVVAQDGQRGILDSTFAFVGLLSLDGTVLDVNQEALSATGHERSQVVGKNFVDLPWFLQTPGERARLTDAVARAGGGRTARFQSTVVGRSGASLQVDAALAMLGDSSETRLVATAVDVTARVAAERALLHSEARLAEAQRVAHVGSWEWEVGGNRVSWSDELYRIYGIGREQFDGTYRGFLARVHPDDLVHTIGVVEGALGAVSAFIYDHRIVRPTGEVRMLHTRGEVVADAQGRPVRLVGSCWDVTERWQATRRLEQSISLLQATLEATADGLLVVEQAGRVTAMNQRLRELWRLPDELAEGTALADLLARVQGQLAEPEDFARKVRDLYADPDRRSLDVLRLADGRVYERLSSPQRVGATTVGRVCSFRDITAREEAEQRLRASTDQLRALAARLDAVREEERRLMAREIHDQIGQALTALKLDLAALRSRLPAGGEADLDVARRAENMDHLIDQTLETARRVSAALRPPILDDLGLAAALRWQAADFEARCGVRCETELPEGELIDPSGALVLFRIVQEALTNVARHAGAQRVRIRLAVEASPAGGLLLTITDDGRGITREEQARPSSLGLVGMRERALVMGGEVTIEGSPGAGTRVTVRVPRSRPPECAS